MLHQKQAMRRRQKHAPVLYHGVRSGAAADGQNPNAADIILRNMEIRVPQRPANRTAVPMASQLFDAQLPVPKPPAAHPVPMLRGRPLIVPNFT